MVPSFTLLREGTPSGRVADGLGTRYHRDPETPSAVDEPTASRRVGADRANLAKGGSPSGITVTSADPDSAVQGDVQKTVHVHGSGFAQGAKATWSVGGDTMQVVTNSTTFVSSSELIAVVTVSPNAPVASYDIAVTNLGGKKGVGVELFAVKSTEVMLALTIDDIGPLGAYRIRSDGLGEYVDGLQGDTVRIDGVGNLRIFGGPHARRQRCRSARSPSTSVRRSIRSTHTSLTGRR